MLILTRWQNECIMIGDDIRVTIVRVQADKIRIGVEAPKGVVVRRQESPESDAGSSAASDLGSRRLP
jgi:carbon storage regulator